MGEAILAKYGSGGGSSSGSGGGIASEGIIAYNMVYEVMKSGNYRICCVGGGQGGQCGYNAGAKENFHCSYGGDSGTYCYANVYLTAGELIPITIGDGGAGGAGSSRLNGSNGGMTVFGDYVYSTSSGFNYNNSAMDKKNGWYNMGISTTGSIEGEPGAVLWLKNDNITLNHTTLRERENDDVGRYWTYQSTAIPSNHVLLSYGKGGNGGTSGTTGLRSNGENGSCGCVIIKFIS